MDYLIEIREGKVFGEKKIFKVIFLFYSRRKKFGWEGYDVFIMIFYIRLSFNRFLMFKVIVGFNIVGNLGLIRFCRVSKVWCVFFFSFLFVW